LGFLGWWGVLQAHEFQKEMYKAQLEFPKGVGVLGKIPTMGEVWIFSGILTDNVICLGGFGR